jgi:hypothetical protein
MKQFLDEKSYRLGLGPTGARTSESRQPMRGERRMRHSPNSLPVDHVPRCERAIFCDIR